MTRLSRRHGADPLASRRRRRAALFGDRLRAARRRGSLYRPADRRPLLLGGRLGKPGRARPGVDRRFGPDPAHPPQPLLLGRQFGRAGGAADRRARDPQSTLGTPDRPGQPRPRSRVGASRRSDRRRTAGARPNVEPHSVDRLSGSGRLEIDGTADRSAPTSRAPATSTPPAPPEKRRSSPGRPRGRAQSPAPTVAPTSSQRRHRRPFRLHIAGTERRPRPLRVDQR